MKIRYSIFIIILILIGCGKDSKQLPKKPLLYHSPEEFDLDMTNGYLVNPFSLDTVESTTQIVSEQLIQVDTIQLRDLNDVFYKRVGNPDRVKIHLHGDPIENVTSTPFKFSVKQGELITGIESKQFNKDSILVTTGIVLNIEAIEKSILFPEPIKADKLLAVEDAILDLHYFDLNTERPAPYMMEIFHDSRNAIWIRDYMSGLMQFNGENLFLFNDQEEFDNAHHLIEDSFGNIWFITKNNNLVKMTGNKLHIFTTDQGLPSHKIKSISAADDGTIWILSGDQFLSCLTNSETTVGYTLINYSSHEGISLKEGRHISTGLNNSIWMIGDSHTLIHHEENQLTYYNFDTTNFVPELSKVQQTKDGIVLISAVEGLYELNIDHHLLLHSDQAIYLRELDDIEVDSKGIIWINAFFDGLIRYDGENFSKINENQGVRSNWLSDFTLDEQDNIWLGTYGGQVNYLRPNGIRNLTGIHGLDNERIWSIKEDSQHNIWLGTEANIVNYDGEYITNFGAAEGYDGELVYQMLTHPNGNLYINSRASGLVVFDGEKFGYNTLPTKSIKHIDNEGNLFYFSSNGLCKVILNGKDVEYILEYNLKNIFPESQFSDMIVDSENQIWIGTFENGLLKLVDNKLTSINAKNGLPNEALGKFLQEGDNLWIKSEKALYRLTHKNDLINSKIQKYDEAQGLTWESYGSLTLDSLDRLWIGTTHGLFCSDSSKSFFSRYIKEDGLAGTYFFNNANQLSKDGTLWFGEGRGLNFFNTNEIGSIFNAVNPKINAVRINNEFINTNSKLDSTHFLTYENENKFISLPSNLTLDYDLNHLKFYFSPANNLASKQIQYSYFLSGVMNNWSVPSSEPSAEFIDLSHGEFILNVITTNNNGKWSHPVSYSFKISPPWWHTWWARMLYGISGLLIIIGLIRSRTQKLEKRQAELEDEVSNATKEIIQQKEIVEEAHKEITDSINYAERIQRSFLASTTLLNQNLGEHFIYFNPKEAISGDFYWAGKLANGNFSVSCADSTGHGVPGAIMSILNISSIEKAVENNESKPAEIFNQARQLIIDRLKKDGSLEGGKDGMDASLISFNTDKTVMQYVAANNPIWIIRLGELIDIKGEKMPVGKHDHDHIQFKGGEFQLQKGDLIYSLTDGFQDQFGGEKGKKYKVKPFKQLLLQISHLPMNEQHQKISFTFDEWKKDLEQVDDVCVIGIKI